MPDMKPQGFEDPGVDHGHEPSGVPLTGIVAFLVGLTVVSISTYLALGGMLRSFNRRDAAVPKVTRSTIDEEGLYPGPRLQQNDALDMAVFRESEVERLAGYGWVDREKGIARIPLERAIDIVAAQGIGKAEGEEPE